MIDYNSAILRLAEVKWTESGRMCQEAHTKCISFEDPKLHRNGVAVVIKNKSANVMPGYWPVLGRTITLQTDAIFVAP